MNAPVSPTESRAGDPAAEWVDPRTLQRWPKNPRRNAKAVASVARSIERYGFGAPIVARMANRMIIAGDTRWLASVEVLKLPLVPVRFLDVDQETADQLALADNKLGEIAEWDDPQVAELLQGFTADEHALMGWSRKEVAALDAALKGKGEVVEDDVPAPPKVPVTQLGDVWLLGRHRLLCGRGESADGTFSMVVTDPPYGVSVVQNGMVGARFRDSVAAKGRYEPIAGDEAPPDVRWLLQRASLAVIWGGNYFADQLPSSGGWLVWDKRGDSGIENTFADCELAWSNRTGPARVHRQLWNGMIRAGEHEQRKHPTQKPVALMAFCVGFGEGHVFDPYAGAGSTLIACEQLGRDCTAVELSPAYCDVIVERWQNLSGQKATRVHS